MALPTKLWVSLTTDKKSAVSAQDVSLHLPFREEHLVAALVPKSPTESPAFGFVFVLPTTVQFLLLISFLVSCLLHWLSQLLAFRAGNRRKQPKLAQAFFYYFSLTFSQTEGKQIAGF